MWGFIIAVVVIVLAMLYINGYQNKFQSFYGKVFNFVVVVALLFGALSIGYVYFKADPDLGNFDGVVQFVRLYFSWLGSLFGNAQSVTGFAVQQDWGGNLTNIGK